MINKMISMLLIGFCCATVTQARVNLNQTLSQVTEGIFRGPRPTQQNLVTLQKLGVKTIINIDNDASEARNEKAAAAQLGINSFSVPLSGFWAPSSKNVDKILALLYDTSLQPIYLHCLHGEDRTGLIVGLYRVEHEKVAPKVAYEEMLKFGFHPALVFLNHYYEERTGFED